LIENADEATVRKWKTAEKAQRLVDAVKFPPIGDRGLDGAGLDSDYLLDDSDRAIWGCGFSDAMIRGLPWKRLTKKSLRRRSVTARPGVVRE